MYANPYIGIRDNDVIVEFGGESNMYSWKHKYFTSGGTTLVSSDMKTVVSPFLTLEEGVYQIETGSGFVLTDARFSNANGAIGSSIGFTAIDTGVYNIPISNIPVDKPYLVLQVVKSDGSIIKLNEAENCLIIFKLES